VAFQPLGAGGAAASLLFTRLPERLFAPLASPNKQIYWGILCALYDRRFGPDAPLPPSHGFTTRDITQDIEAELVIHDSWIDEDGATPETPLNIRAITIFNRLHDCGWLRLDRHGVDKRVSMTPTVNQFLGQLINFAETTDLRGGQDSLHRSQPEAGDGRGRRRLAFRGGRPGATPARTHP
jgi:hypothetical protein